MLDQLVVAVGVGTSKLDDDVQQEEDDARSIKLVTNSVGEYPQGAPLQYAPPTQVQPTTEERLEARRPQIEATVEQLRQHDHPTNITEVMMDKWEEAMIQIKEMQKKFADASKANDELHNKVAP